jgi:protein-disulfide isomerase
MLLAVQTGITAETAAGFGERFAASDRGLDSNSYRECMASTYPETRLQADLAAGSSLDVHSTPSVFLNGRRYGGFPDEAALARAIRLAEGAAIGPAKETEQ